MDNKEQLKELLKKVTVTNVGEVKDDDLLVFQFDYNKIDAHVVGTFMKMISEQGFKVIAYPQSDCIVKKYDAEKTLMILELAKKSVEEIIANRK